MINGQVYDWESVTIQLPSGVSIGVQSIDYSDERPVSERYGKGSVPRGAGRGNYKATASIELDLDEAQRLALALGGSIYSGPPFPIVVSYGDTGLPTVVDVLPICRITKTGSGAKQGDDNVGKRKYDIAVLAPIAWGGAPALVPGA